MKKFIVLILLIPAISIAQINKNNVVFKDGVEMNMTEFITNCKNSANNADGIEAYCLCFIENVSKNWVFQCFFKNRFGPKKWSLLYNLGLFFGPKNKKTRAKKQKTAT